MYAKNKVVFKILSSYNYHPRKILVSIRLELSRKKLEESGTLLINPGYAVSMRKKLLRQSNKLRTFKNNPLYAPEIVDNHLSTFQNITLALIPELRTFIEYFRTIQKVYYTVSIQLMCTDARSKSL